MQLEENAGSPRQVLEFAEPLEPGHNLGVGLDVKQAMLPQGWLEPQQFPDFLHCQRPLYTSSQ